LNDGRRLCRRLVHFWIEVREERAVSKARSTKRDVDQQKKERAARKRERRAAGHEGADLAPSIVAAPAVPEQEVLARLDELHARFEADEVDFTDYEHAKDELIAMLGSD
jgi:hypothetical protein